MKTREQKKQIISETEKLINESSNVAFVDFSGVSVSDIQTLRRSLKALGATMKIIKKKLLRVSFEKKGVDFDPEQFESQLGTIFSSAQINEVLSPVAKFLKEKEKQGFRILGAYDLSEKRFMDSEMAKMIGQLPPREILLAQLVGMLAAPMKMFLYVLDQKSKKV